MAATAASDLTLENAGFVRRLRELSGASDLVWLVAMSTGLGFTLIAAYAFAFSPSGKFWAYASLFIRASLYLWSGEVLAGRGGETLARLFKMGSSPARSSCSSTGG